MSALSNLSSNPLKIPFGMQCLLQGWYLAADTHSFVLSLVLLMLGHRFVRWSKQLYAGILGLFVVVPMVLTYAMNYYPIFVPTPQ